jgi:hypothetical protein
MSSSGVVPCLDFPVGLFCLAREFTVSRFREPGDNSNYFSTASTNRSRVPISTLVLPYMVANV